MKNVVAIKTRLSCYFYNSKKIPFVRSPTFENVFIFRSEMKTYTNRSRHLLQCEKYFSFVYFWPGESYRVLCGSKFLVMRARVSIWPYYGGKGLPLEENILSFYYGKAFPEKCPKK